MRFGSSRTSSTATASNAVWPRDEPRSRPARPGRRPSSCGAPGRALEEVERGILAQEVTLDASPSQPAAGVAPGRRAAAPMLGREDELALLEAGLADALAGRGRLFVVAGAPGSGKTRLGDE